MTLSTLGMAAEILSPGLNENENEKLGAERHERVYIPLYKVAYAPFHIQGNH